VALPLLYFYAMTDSNPFIWDSPVDCPCHQCKHWWLHIFSFPVEGKENASRVRSPLTSSFKVRYEHPYQSPKSFVCKGFWVFSFPAEIFNPPQLVNISTNFSTNFLHLYILTLFPATTDYSSLPTPYFSFHLF